MDLILNKDGYITTKIWEYDEKEEGQYVYRTLEGNDVSALNYLQYNTELENGYTIRDIFKMVSRYEVFQMLDNYWMSFIEDYNKCPDSGCLSKEFKYIRIYKSIEKTIYIYENGDKECLVWNHVDAKKLNEDDVNYSLMFVKLSEILDHELKLDSLTISEDNHNIDVKTRLTGIYKIEKWDTQYTLWEILHSIIYELSFSGTPEEKQAASNEILEISKNIENGTEELIEINFDDLGE